MSAGTKSNRKLRGPRRAPQACGPDVWDIPPWCGQLGIGRGTYYTLKQKPRSVRLGKLVKIIEAPAEYTRRIAALAEKERDSLSCT